MDIPKLSVIIPCYNQGVFLLELLDCFPNYSDQSTYEVIIINDGSNDEETLSILTQVETDGFCILHQQNQGVCVARNNGINIAQGQFILPVDGDDKISSKFIYEALEIFERKPDLSVVYCDAEYFGVKNGKWSVGEFNLQRLMLWNYFPISCVFRKSAWSQVKGFDPEINGLEDWDFWLSIAFNGGKFHYISKVFFYYRILSTSANRSLTPSKYKELQEKIEIKHARYLNKYFLNEHFTSKFKGNRKLWFKLFLKVYFPGLLEKLVKKGKLSSINLD